MTEIVQSSILQNRPPTTTDGLTASGIPIGKGWLDTTTNIEYIQIRDGIWQQNSTTLPLPTPDAGVLPLIVDDTTATVSFVCPNTVQSWLVTDNRVTTSGMAYFNADVVTDTSTAIQKVWVTIPCQVILTNSVGTQTIANILPNQIFVFNYNTATDNFTIATFNTASLLDFFTYDPTTQTVVLTPDNAAINGNGAFDIARNNIAGLHIDPAYSAYLGGGQVLLNGGATWTNLSAGGVVIVQAGNNYTTVKANGHNVLDAGGDGTDTPFYFSAGAGGTQNIFANSGELQLNVGGELILDALPTTTTIHANGTTFLAAGVDSTPSHVPFLQINMGNTPIMQTGPNYFILNDGNGTEMISDRPGDGKRILGDFILVNSQGQNTFYYTPGNVYLRAQTTEEFSKVSQLYLSGTGQIFQTPTMNFTTQYTESTGANSSFLQFNNPDFFQIPELYRYLFNSDNYWQPDLRILNPDVSANTDKNNYAFRTELNGGVPNTYFGANHLFYVNGLTTTSQDLRGAINELESTKISLDTSGKIPLSLLPGTLLKYIGVWNASTNDLGLVSPDLTKVGNVYTVGVAGTQFGLSFNLGDWAIYNNIGVVQLSLNSDDVTSVCGKQGAITLSASDVGAVPTTTTVNGHALNANIYISAADTGAVPTYFTVNGHQLNGNVTVSATDLGLGNVNNTADTAKPVSTAQAAAIAAVTTTSIGAEPTITKSTGLLSWTGTAWAWITNNFVPNTTTVNGHALSANVTVTATDLGLGNVNNTADTAKPVSTAQAAAIAAVTTTTLGAEPTITKSTGLLSWTGTAWAWITNNFVPNTTTVNGHALSANVTVTATDLSLGNVNNTSDANKPVSTAQAAAIAAVTTTTLGAVPTSRTINGHALSANVTVAYSDLTGQPTIPAAQVNSDWNASTGLAQILNKPTIPTTASQVGAEPTITKSTGILSWTGTAWAWITNNFVPNTTTVNGHALSANVTVTATDLSLGNVNNTSDANKPVSTAQAAAIAAVTTTSIGAQPIKVESDPATIASIASPIAVAGNVDVYDVTINPTDNASAAFSLNLTYSASSFTAGREILVILTNANAYDCTVNLPTTFSGKTIIDRTGDTFIVPAASAYNKFVHILPTNNKLIVTVS
jgi:hypothetical protein